jgi:nucleotide-binding universal stress UspA family protein
MLKHILLPLDGSEIAEKAVEHAQKLVNPGGEITLLVAVDAPEYINYSIYGTQPIAPTVVSPQTAFDYQALTDEMVAQSNTYLERIAQDLQSSGYKVQRMVELGSAADLIVDTAEKLGVDAIVMSTHGRSGLSRWLLGSVTSKVLGHASCPVYVIPPDRSKNEA